MVHMSLYQYIKVYPKVRKRRKHSSIISFSFMGLGLGILIWSIWPIISFSLFSAPLFSNIISPLTEQKVTVQSNMRTLLSPLVNAASDDPNTTFSDFTNPNLWFPTKPQKKVVTPVNTYTLSIPKLHIENATVTIFGSDLNKSLIHYGGTSLPGEYGTAVIFGHSVLPQFFDPKNYKTIFSTLPALETGDEISVTYDGLLFRYIVESMVVTDPHDLSPLEQVFDDSYITLVTCVPPGTYWKRLNVKARLSNLPS